MNKYLCAAALAASVPALAAERFTLDPTHTFPSFEIRHHGVSTLRGKFNRSAGKAQLDRDQGTGRIEVTVEAASVDTGHDGLNRMLLAPNFFNTALHPTIRFVSDSVNFQGGKPIEATGQLTMLGVTRTVTLEIRDFTCTVHFLSRATLCGADVHTTLRRSDYGMNFGLPNLIGDEVKLAIEVEGYKD